jgi:hypothetical protein
LNVNSSTKSSSKAEIDPRGRRFVKDDPNVKFATTITSLVRSLDPYALFNNNSFYQVHAQLGHLENIAYTM